MKRYYEPGSYYEKLLVKNGMKLGIMEKEVRRAMYGGKYNNYAPTEFMDIIDEVESNIPESGMSDQQKEMKSLLREVSNA